MARCLRCLSLELRCECVYESAVLIFALISFQKLSMGEKMCSLLKVPSAVFHDPSGDVETDLSSLTRQAVKHTCRASMGTPSRQQL